MKTPSTSSESACSTSRCTRKRKGSELRYILTNRYSLCGYKGVPYALYDEDYGRLQAISLADFIVLEGCDGRTELRNSKTLQKLKRQGIIRQPLLGEVLEERRRYHDYGVPLFSGVSFSPTARCNYNCRHCFMAKDVNPQAAQLTYEECIDLFDQMVDCGIREIRFTGGEPTIHPQFRDILWAAKERGLRVREVLTNGSRLTDELLGEMRAHEMNPLIMISFDGVGRHDWLRNVKGAEEVALSAMERAARKGFPVTAHVCVHRGNIDVLRETARKLDEIGVEVMRVIRVSEAPRWMTTSTDSNLEPKEYFDAVLDFLDWYVDSGLKPMLELWSMLRWYPQENVVEWLPARCADEARRERRAICPGARNVLQIAADRDIFPCNIISGAMRSRGYVPRSLKNESIRHLISDDEWMRETFPTLADFYEANPECKECEHRLDCQGGCRAIGFAVTGNLCGIDLMRCAFMKEGHFARARAIINRKLEQGQ